MCNYLHSWGCRWLVDIKSGTCPHPVRSSVSVPQPQWGAAVCFSPPPAAGWLLHTESPDRRRWRCRSTAAGPPEHPLPAHPGSSAPETDPVENIKIKMSISIIITFNLDCGYNLSPLVLLGSWQRLNHPDCAEKPGSLLKTRSTRTSWRWFVSSRLPSAWRHPPLLKQVPSAPLTSSSSVSQPSGQEELNIFNTAHLSF